VGRHFRSSRRGFVQVIPDGFSWNRVQTSILEPKKKGLSNFESPEWIVKKPGIHPSPDLQKQKWFFAQSEGGARRRMTFFRDGSALDTSVVGRWAVQAGNFPPHRSNVGRQLPAMVNRVKQS